MKELYRTNPLTQNILCEREYSYRPKKVRNKLLDGKSGLCLCSLRAEHDKGHVRREKSANTQAAGGEMKGKKQGAKSVSERRFQDWFVEGESLKV